MSIVKLISLTNDAEQLMAYCARVSNPTNQNNDDYAKLLKYCILHKHWSIFEQAFMTIEITTTRGLAAQILRHRSFTFQEFSQRYADTTLLSEDIPPFELRRQDTKNRQNSIDDISDEIKAKWGMKIREHFAKSKSIGFEHSSNFGSTFQSFKFKTSNCSNAFLVCGIEIIGFLQTILNTCA